MLIFNLLIYRIHGLSEQNIYTVFLLNLQLSNYSIVVVYNDPIYIYNIKYS
jgi:hypothetical protein